jgi:hypothetical protein
MPHIGAYTDNGLCRWGQFRSCSSPWSVRGKSAGRVRVPGRRGSGPFQGGGEGRRVSAPLPAPQFSPAAQPRLCPGPPLPPGPMGEQCRFRHGALLESAETTAFSRPSRTRSSRTPLVDNLFYDCRKYHFPWFCRRQEVVNKFQKAIFSGAHHRHRSRDSGDRFGSADTHTIHRMIGCIKSALTLPVTSP